MENYPETSHFELEALVNNVTNLEDTGNFEPLELSEARGSAMENFPETFHFEHEAFVNNVTNLEDTGNSMQPLNFVGGSCGHAEALAVQMGVQEGEQVHCIGLNEKQGETWLCAICRDKIKAEETAQIKGCEHSYCVTCILRWASYKTAPWCPQCRLPFSFLYVYRALDGSLSEYMFEESVCLLLRAFWFKPLQFQEVEEQDDFQDDYDVDEEYYYTSNVRLGNRRWGDSGYVRGGRREARPVGVRQVVAVASESSSLGSSSRQAKGKEKGKEPAKEATGRRARRAQKRELYDKMAGKQQHSEGKSTSLGVDVNTVK